MKKIVWICSDCNHINEVLDGICTKCGSEFELRTKSPSKQHRNLIIMQQGYQLKKGSTAAHIEPTTQSAPPHKRSLLKDIIYLAFLGVKPHGN